MPGYKIDFTPCSDGTFPDCTGTPLDQWLIVRAGLAAGLTIEVAAKKEFALRSGGQEAPQSERISWRQYFSWLAGVDSSEDLTWPELKEKVYESLSELFGEPVDVVPRPNQVPAEEIRHSTPIESTRPISTPQERENQQKSREKHYWETVRSIVPGVSIGQSFSEIYVNRGGGNDGEK